MKWARIEIGDKSSYGIVEENQIALVKGGIFDQINFTGQKVKTEDAKFLTPIEPKTSRQTANGRISVGTSARFMSCLPVCVFKQFMAVVWKAQLAEKFEVEEEREGAPFSLPSPEHTSYFRA